MMNYNVKQIATASAPIVEHVLKAYALYGVPSVVHGRYKYVLQELWDGSRWRHCVARIPMESILEDRLEPSCNGFGSYHYAGTVVYAYID